MTWTQTLIVAAIPALVASLALVWQTKISGNAATRALEHAERMRRLDGATAAHEVALDTFEVLWAALAPFVTAAKDARRDGEPPFPVGTVAARGQLSAFTGAYTRVVLTGSKEATEALHMLRVSLGALLERITDPQVRVPLIEISDAMVQENLRIYRAAARLDTVGDRLGYQPPPPRWQRTRELIGKITRRPPDPASELRTWRVPLTTSNRGARNS